MADLAILLNDFERAALSTMAECYGMTPDEMASALVGSALDQVVCGVVFDSPSQTPAGQPDTGGRHVYH